MEPGDFHFFTRMFKELGDALNGYVNSTASSVISAITPVATTLLVLYAVLWGWSMMRGVISEPILDGATRIVRLAVIIAIAINLGYYNGFLSDWLWDAPDALAVVVGGAGTAVSNISFLDTLLTQMFDFGLTYYNFAQANTTLGIPSLGPLFTAFAIWALGILVTGFGAFLFALAKMSLAVALGIGPLFVLMLIFEPTKRFFDVWIGQVLNYVFLVMLTAAAIKLVLTILQHYLQAPDLSVGNPSINQAVPAIGFSLVGLLVLMQMPSIASALGGGTALGTLGAANWAYNKATNGALGAKNLATGKTLSDLRGARRHKAMNARWAANNPGVASRAGSRAKDAYSKVSGASKNSVARG